MKYGFKHWGEQELMYTTVYRKVRGLVTLEGTHLHILIQGFRKCKGFELTLGFSNT